MFEAGQATQINVMPIKGAQRVSANGKASLCDVYVCETQTVTVILLFVCEKTVGQISRNPFPPVYPVISDPEFIQSQNKSPQVGFW